MKIGDINYVLLMRLEQYATTKNRSFFDGIRLFFVFNYFINRQYGQ